MAPKIKFNPIQLEDEKDKHPLSPTPPPLESGQNEENKESPLGREGEEQPKKRKGRPPGTKNSKPLDVLPPIDGFDGEESSEPAKKKPGRPRKNNKNTAASLRDPKKMAEQIFGWHQMLNVFFPGTAISEAKSQTMGTALAEVMNAFDIQVNEKVTALIGLGTAVAIVELPVGLEVRKQLRYRALEQRAKKQAQTDGKSIAQQSEAIAKGEPFQEEKPTQEKVFTNSGGESYAVG